MYKNRCSYPLDIEALPFNVAIALFIPRGVNTFHQKYSILVKYERMAKVYVPSHSKKVAPGRKPLGANIDADTSPWVGPSFGGDTSFWKSAVHAAQYLLQGMGVPPFACLCSLFRCFAHGPTVPLGATSQKKVSTDLTYPYVVLSSYFEMSDSVSSNEPSV
jgi:hypothetical protein